jgi:hypothetical protein
MLQAGAPSVRVTQFGDERIDSVGLSGAGGKLAHLREASGCELVVLGAAVEQFVFDESSVDGQHGERIDRFVRLGDLGPRMGEARAVGGRRRR